MKESPPVFGQFDALGVSRDLVIVGAGGHATSVMDAAISAGFNPIGFFDAVKRGTVCGLPVFSSLEEVDVANVELALGIGTNFAREDAYNEIMADKPGSRFPPIIHGNASISPSASVAPGAVVMSMAIVGTGCILERGALLNAGASLDHHSKLSAFASLGPGAQTGGGVHIGMRSMVGIGATIMHGVSVGDDSVVGANSLVTRDLRSAIVAYGTPAVVKRERQTAEPYY